MTKYQQLLSAILVGVIALGLEAQPNAADGSPLGDPKNVEVGTRHAQHVDYSPWKHGDIGGVSSTDAYFRRYLSSLVNTAAATLEVGEPNVLRERCPFSVAFYFENEGDAYVVDFGKTEAPSIDYTTLWDYHVDDDLVASCHYIL